MYADIAIKAQFSQEKRASAVMKMVERSGKNNRQGKKAMRENEAAACKSHVGHCAVILRLP